MPGSGNQHGQLVQVPVGRSAFGPPSVSSGNFGNRCIPPAVSSNFEVSGTDSGDFGFLIAESRPNGRWTFSCDFLKKFFSRAGLAQVAVRQMLPRGRGERCDRPGPKIAIFGPKGVLNLHVIRRGAHIHCGLRISDQSSSVGLRRDKLRIEPAFVPRGLWPATADADAWQAAATRRAGRSKIGPSINSGQALR